MTIIPLSNLINSVDYTNSGVKNATGMIRDWEKLLQPETIERLRAQHQGVICYLAFDSLMDTELLNYIQTGSLSSEAGDEVLILFSINKIVESMTMIEEEELKEIIEFDHKENVNHKVLQAYFNDASYQALPGLLIFDNIANSKNSIYVPLNKTAHPQQLDGLRKVLEIIHQQIGKRGFKSSLIDAIATDLVREKLEYEKNNNYSFGEGIILFYRILMKAKSDLISIFL